MTENPEKAGASEGDEKATKATEPKADHKLEVKEDVMSVDGKKIVFESDLIAAKKKLEGQINDAQKVHEEAVDKVKLEADEVRKISAQATARVKELEDAHAKGVISEEEVTKARKEADDAKANVLKANVDTAKYRRELIAKTYDVPIDQVPDEPTKLEAFENAIKALAQAKGGGPGKYATAGGGTSQTPQTDLERRLALINATPQRGVRKAETD